MVKQVVVIALVAACSGRARPPAEPAPSAPATVTPPQPATISADECLAKSGHVTGDIGDGKVACGPGERDIGRVNQGIEGALCCVAGEPATP